MGCLPSKQETWLKSEKNSYKLWCACVCVCVCVWTHVYLWPVSQISKYNYFISNHHCTIFVSDKLVTLTNLHTGVSVKKKRKNLKQEISNFPVAEVEPRTDEFPDGVCKKKVCGKSVKALKPICFFHMPLIHNCSVQTWLWKRREGSCWFIAGNELLEETQGCLWRNCMMWA